MSVPIRIGHYRLGKTLGKGSFGKVKIAEHELTGHKVAVKIINRSALVKSSQMDRKIRREIKILKLFRHPHIIRLYEVIETATDIFMVMEYVSGGELFEYIVSRGRLSEDEARRFFQQIISGVEYCHRFMVVHRDLKPENLLLDADLNVKIADFGLSNIMSDGDFLKTSCGSPNYAAPEVISGKLYAGPEVDVWSCGVILYALLCGRLPFDEENIPSLFRKIKEGIYTIPRHVSDLSRDLIEKILVVDPLKRATMADIRAHPWFQANLPLYLSAPPTQLQIESATIDEEVLVEAIKKIGGMSMEEAAEALRKSEMNEITVAYQLILDQKTRRQQAEQHARDAAAIAAGQPAPSSSSSMYATGPLSPRSQAAVQQAAAAVVAASRSPRQQTPHSGAVSPVPDFTLDEFAPGSLLPQFAISPHQSGNVAMSYPSSVQQQFASSVGTAAASAFDVSMRGMPMPSIGPDGSSSSGGGVLQIPQAHWNLGILVKCSPNEAMAEAYRVLREMNMEWKTVGQFHIQARLRPDALLPTASSPSSAVVGCGSQSMDHGLELPSGSLFGGNSMASKQVLLGLQVFKMPESGSGYLLDLKKMSGELFPFMDMCASFFTRFRLAENPCPS